MLLEKIPLAGIARVMQLSASWLQRYINRCYQILPQRVRVQPKPKGPLIPFRCSVATDPGLQTPDP
jgi:hypothetical protein